MRKAAWATLAGLAVAGAHALLVPVLVDATARPTLAVRWSGALVAEPASPGEPTVPAEVSHDGGAPGLVWTRWTVTYRGGITRSVGAPQLVGPFQDPAAPPCSGRLAVGQRLLDDGAAGDGTVAAIIAAELRRELTGTEQVGAGRFQRVEDVHVRWAALTSHPRDVALFPAAALRAPTPTGFLRATATVVFERVRVPVTIGALPRTDGGVLGFTIGVRARLEFGSRVLDWVNAKVGGDRLVSRAVSAQLDTALLAALGPPPPLTIPGGPTLTVELCADRPVQIDEAGWAAVPLRWKLGGPVAMASGPPARPPRRGPAALPPPDPATPVTIDLELDGLNGLLYELWRTGWLDRQLDEVAAHERFNRDPTVAEYLSLRLSPLRLELPPTLAPAPGGGLALGLALRVDLADGALLTPGHAWAALAVDLHTPPGPGAPGIAAAVGVTALELACEPTPGRLEPCYGDIVSAIRDAAPGTHAQLAGALTRALDDVFVARRLTAAGAPAALDVSAARARVLAAGDGRAMRVELGARLAPP